MNGLVKKFFEFAIGNGIVIILGIVTTFIGTRLIQPLESGKTDTFISYSGLIVLLVTMGIDQAFIRYYNDEKEENRGSLLRKSLVYPVGLSILIILVCLLLYKTMSMILVKEENLFISVMFGINILISVINNFALINIRMKQQAKLYSLVSASNKIGYVAALLGFYGIFGDNYRTLIYTIVGANLIMLIFALIVGRKEWFGRGNKAQTQTKTLRKYGMPFIFSMGLTWIFQSAAILSMNLLIKNSNEAAYQVGVYGGAMKIVAILNTIQGVFTTFWIPIAYERYAKAPEDTKFFSKISEIVSFFMLCFAAGLMLLKDVVINFLGRGYVDAKFIFPFLVMMPIMYTISETTFLGINFKKQTKKHITISGIAAAFNVIGNIILVPYLGARGAAISTGLAYIVFFAVRTYYGNKYYKIDIKYSRFIPSLLAVYGYAILSSIYSYNNIILVTGLLTFAILFISYRELISQIIKMAISKIKK